MDSGFSNPQRPDDRGRLDRPAGKRGRKQTRPDPADGPVARFAHELSELKRTAGDPSYDRMRARLGAAASKSALSAAARGKNLPSWDTTWEFVRSLAVVSLGQDEEAVRREWLVRWQRANDPRSGSGDTADAPATSPEASEDPTSATESTQPARPPQAAQASESARSSEAAQSPQNPRQPVSPRETETGRGGTGEPEATNPVARLPRHRLTAGMIAVLVAVLGAITLVAVLSSGGTTPAATTEAAPLPQGGRYPIPGDSSAPGSTPDGSDLDVTIPDGTVVRVDEPFVKTWRIRNNGSIRWENRYLQSFGDTTHMCESVERVRIPRTEPGEVVDVSLRVVPKHEGTCHVPWKMVDERGELVFPTQLRAVFYQVRVIR